MLRRDKFDRLRKVLKERILVLDGGMGTELQCDNDASRESHGNDLPDLMTIHAPETVRNIHCRYLAAGADIIETNTFNANRLSISLYGGGEDSYFLSLKGASLARTAADHYSKLTPAKPRFVAGAVGPTPLMLSKETTDSEVNFDILRDDFGCQIRGLLEGGADLVMIETVTDLLNAKAASDAITRIEKERGEKIPAIISCVVSAEGGILPDGHSVEEFLASVNHLEPLAVGINCCSSADIHDLLRRFSGKIDTAICAYPNAGMPDSHGQYTENSDEFLSYMMQSLNEGLINIAGGCCGTTPSHIKRLAEFVKNCEPRKFIN